MWDLGANMATTIGAVKAAGASGELCEKSLSPARPILAVERSVQRRFKPSRRAPSCEVSGGGEAARRHALCWTCHPSNRDRGLQGENRRLDQGTTRRRDEGQEATIREQPTRPPTHPPATLSSAGT